MSLPTLIQVLCEEQGDAQLTIRDREEGEEGSLFFSQGQVVHAQTGTLVGEEAVYELLSWEEGTFVLERSIPPPEQTIHTEWSALLLEGLRRLDEQRESARLAPPHPGEAVADIQWPEGLDENRDARKEGSTMAKRSELLMQTLDELLTSSADIEGGAIVSTDGLILAANVPTGGLDEAHVGAVAAAILGLSKRSVHQLKRGDFTQTLVQGNQGNIIVTTINDRTLFVGITSQDANLGMAFLEARETAQKVADILG